jgi:hypothetical protein
MGAALCLFQKKSVYEAADHGIYPDGSDIGESLHNLITNVQANGGGTIQFQSGEYYTSRTVEFLYGGSPVNQANIWIRGTAPHAAYSAASRPRSGTVLLLNSTNGNYHIISRGFGTLKLTDISFVATNRSGAAFIKIIHTTPKFKDLMFYGSEQNPSCTEDGIVLGGDGPPDFTSGGDAASFQGYGAKIEDCYFNRIRVPIRLAAHANAVWFSDNVIMNECGGTNNPWGAAQVLDGLGWGSVTGNRIGGTLIEMPGFSIGTYFGRGASMNQVVFNNHYDARPELNPVAYWFQDSGSGNKVDSGQVTIHMALKGGNTAFNQDIRTSVALQTNDIYTVTHQRVGFRFVGHSAQPYYVHDPYAVTHRLSDNGMIWSVANPETGGSYVDTMRMGKIGGNRWLSLYGDGYFYSGNDSHFLSEIGAKAYIGDHQQKLFVQRGNLISSGTNTYNAYIGGSPVNLESVSGWLPITNNGVRHYLPLYQ